MANWQKFTQDFSDFLSSNKSSGPFETGRKLSELYVNTVKGSKAIPANNSINGGIAQSFKPILDLGFGLGFFLLQNSKKTFGQLQKDKNYYDGSAPLPAEQEKNVLSQEPQVEKFDLSNFFSKLTEEDLEDIRKNSSVTFRLRETSGKESSKIFNYKEPFDFNVPENTRIAIFGNTFNKAKSGILDYGFMGAINTILNFDREENREDGQNEISERPFGSFRFVDFYNILLETLDEDPGDLLDKAVRNNTGNQSGTEAVKSDFNILRGLYTAELEAWIDVVTPYITKRLSEGEVDTSYSESSKKTPFALGLSTNGSDFISVIKEDYIFPAVSSRSVTTIGDYQKEIQFKIAKLIDGNVSLLRDVKLEGIQSALAGVPIVNIKFDLKNDESLDISVFDIVTESQESFSIKKVFGETSYTEISPAQSPGSPIIPSNAVQEQNAVKDAKNSVKDVLSSLPSDMQQKLINFGLDAKIADLVSKGDPYLIMASSVVLYWSLVGLVPICFNPTPPVPPASIPVPGLFTIIFPGLPITLSKKLRLALNVGLDPSIFPKLDPSGEIQKLALQAASRDSQAFQSLTKAIDLQKLGIKQKTDAKIIPLGVSGKLAIAFATHLLSLKFIYTGSTQAGPATVPTPGFVLAVF